MMTELVYKVKNEAIEKMKSEIEELSISKKDIVKIIIGSMIGTMIGTTFGQILKEFVVPKEINAIRKGIGLVRRLIKL